jgi:AGCS family alanine or glycine:cation symporter
MTALVIIISGQHRSGAEGITLTSDAFATVIGWFPYLLAIAVLLFAFSTMISWSYYGVKAWGYIFGSAPGSIIIYKIIFCLFIVVGASVDREPLVGFGDGMLFAMSLPNIVGCYILAPLVKRDMKAFLKRIKQDKVEA